MTNRLFILDLDDTLAETTRCLGGNKLLLPNLELVPGLPDLLDACSGDRLILLTATNDQEYQTRKVDHLGIREHFEVIHMVPQPADKRYVLEHLISDFGGDPRNVIIIGDRLDSELKFGKELGCTTIRVCLPEGKYATCVCEPGSEPDFVATNLSEISTFLRSL